MSNTDDIDKFGHCVICHKNLLTKRIVDGKQIDMFLPIYNETIFILDNGSQMLVTICTPCKETNDLNDSKVHAKIMEAVQRGWELETKLLIADEKLPDWTEEKGKEYLDKMAKLSIACSSDLMSKQAIQLKQFELAGIKFMEIKDSDEVQILEVSNGDN